MPVSRNAVLAAALVAAIITTTPAAAGGGSVDRQFRNAVSRVLESVRSQEEFLSSLSASEFRAFVSCAQGVMSAAPTARKQYVLAARNLNAMRQRFDEVALDNRAALKQRITSQCAA